MMRFQASSVKITVFRVGVTCILSPPPLPFLAFITVIEIEAYPSSLASTVSETQWAEFCEEIDKCIYGFKVSRAWTIGVFALFVCILLIFVIVPLVLSGVFALRNVNKKELVVDYRLSAVNWGPWKVIISVDTNEITHTEQEPGSSDDFTEFDL